MVSKSISTSRSEDSHTSSMYKTWKLPNPPSFDFSEDIPPPLASGYTEFDSWKRDLDGFLSSPKQSKLPITYIEWKNSSSSKRRDKKKKSSDSIRSSSESIRSSTESIRSCTSNEETKKDRLYGSQSKKHLTSKENTPPSFRPSFSQTRYSRQQKYRALTSLEIHDKKLIGEARQDQSQEELQEIKRGLSDLKKKTRKNRDSSSTKHVHFSHPLISSVNYRPKTLPNEVDALFFREDELLDWEEDRETTSGERIEISISAEEGEVAISSDCLSCSSNDSHAEI